METVILKHYYIDKHLMIGKKKINQIKSLAQRKVRNREQLFLVEGDKTILEVLNSSLEVKELYATEGFLLDCEQHLHKVEKVTMTTVSDIKKASLLKSPQNSLAVCLLPPAAKIPGKISGLGFYLDGIQDPGNLGTILRICDWFGMEYLFCSPDTADVFNPKVIQSSMGSFCRVTTIYASFNDVLLLASHSEIPVYGTFMEGESLYSLTLPSNALIVMGNEGNGMRPEVTENISNKLNIPSFNIGKTGAESLNVAVAAGIIGNEFRRQMTARTFIQSGS